MAEPTTEQLIKDHLATLPKPVKDAINSFDWAREVFDVGRKYNMHVDDIGELQNEVMLVVLGITSPREFQDEVRSNIETDLERADTICGEINEKVFLRIRDFMKNYYAEEEKKGKEIISSERNVLRGAGISLGDEPEESLKEETKQVLPKETPNQPIIKKAAPSTPVAAVIPNIAAKLENSEVFKNKSSNYLDPYREPIE